MEAPGEASPGPGLRLGDVHHVVADGVLAVVAAGVPHHLLLTSGALLTLIDTLWVAKILNFESANRNF